MMLSRKKKIKIFSYFLVLSIALFIGMPSSFFDNNDYSNIMDEAPKEIDIKNSNEIYQKQYINDIIKNYEENSKYTKLDKKWKKAIENRIKREEEYRQNILKEPHVLHVLKTNKKNLDMSYTNTKPITQRKKNYTPLTSEEIKIENKKIGKAIEEFYTAPKIERCQNDFNEIIANPIKNDFKDDEVLDFLILKKDILQNIDKSQILNKDFFGNKNSIYFYSQEFLDFFSLSLRNQKIKCLPLRIIVTKNTVYKYYGVNALKYYDYTQSGIFHHWVKQHINKFLG